MATRKDLLGLVRFDILFSIIEYWSEGAPDARKHGAQWGKLGDVFLVWRVAMPQPHKQEDQSGTVPQR